MQKKILFVINPISGVGRQKTVEKAIDLYLDKNQFQYEIFYTERAKHAIEIGKNVAGKYDIVVAVGGDGSVNELSQGLIGSETVLAIIPTGSGNGLARFLKIPLNIPKAISVINQCNIKKIDTLRINDRNFVNVAGVGFDGLISHRFAEHNKRGFWGYFEIVVKELFHYKPKRYNVIIDGVKQKKQRSFLISLANSAQFGLNAYVSPNSKIDDGLVEVCFFKKFPPIITPYYAFKMFNKTVHKSRKSTIISGKEIEISHKKQIFAHIDGEAVDFGNKINVSMNHLSLNVIVP